MKIEPAAKYFSIWRGALSVLAQHTGLMLGATMLLASPFFILSGLANARHMMTLGGAAMMGVDIPSEQMRLLWGVLVGADSLASIALGTAVLLTLTYLSSQPEDSFVRHVRSELPRLFCRAGFWGFVIAQVAVFGMINSPDGRFKLLGMLLFGCSVLLLLCGQDHTTVPVDRLRRLRWSGWLALVLVLLTVPLLYIFFNGYMNAVLLMLTDFSAQKIVHFLGMDLQSPVLPYGVIIVSRFVSQCLNLLLMAFLLSTCLALRGKIHVEPDTIP